MSVCTKPTWRKARGAENTQASDQHHTPVLEPCREERQQRPAARWYCPQGGGGGRTTWVRMNKTEGKEGRRGGEWRRRNSYGAKTPAVCAANAPTQAPSAHKCRGQKHHYRHVCGKRVQKGASVARGRQNCARHSPVPNQHPRHVVAQHLWGDVRHSARVLRQQNARATTKTQEGGHDGQHFGGHGQTGGAKDMKWYKRHEVAQEAWGGAKKGAPKTWGATGVPHSL
jgi:hypothetical protein